jgi:asparagine synthase (glutamine-hydrolysing)
MLDNASTTNHDILCWIKRLSGHFAIVVESNKWVVAVTDKICTHPIFVATYENNVSVSNHAPLLKEEYDFGESDLCLSAGLEIAMSGYTIGNKTLYSSINRLEGGECLLFNQGSLFREFYYTYSPWKVRYRTESQLKKELTNICINALTELKNNSNGRQILVPLSAGNDSRLIASGLREIEVKNVICFSYGRKDNFETPVSKEIARKLGYEWLYIPVNAKSKYNFFKSNIYHKYITEFESYGSVPNIQEIVIVVILFLAVI